MTHESDNDDGPKIDNSVIRIQLRKPPHRQWELNTNNKAERIISFPIIQLFDCEGNLLIETNDDNISIRSSDLSNGPKNGLRKRKTVHGDKIFTNIFNNLNYDRNSLREKNIPYTDNIKIALPLRHNSQDTISVESEMVGNLDNSSFKSSDNDSSAFEPEHTYVTSKAGTLLISSNKNENSPFRRRRSDRPNTLTSSNVEINFDPQFYENYAPASVKSRIHKFEKTNLSEPMPNALKKSTSLMNACVNNGRDDNWNFEQGLSRTQSQIIYKKPQNRVSFLETYMRSLPQCRKEEAIPEWCHAKSEETPSNSHNTSLTNLSMKNIREKKSYQPEWRYGRIWEDFDVVDLPSDEAANTVIKRRLRQYRKGISVVDYPSSNLVNRNRNRRFSEGDECKSSSSSESLDEADVILNRLRRRILKNKKRERKSGHNLQPFRKYQKPNFHEDRCRSLARSNAITRCHCQSCLEELSSRREVMGANLSHHSVKGLTGRRARSSGDLCNGDSKSQTDTSVYGSVVGDGIGWNRSLPNHLDSNRLPSDYNERSNNNYEIANGRYPNKRALRYRPSKTGSDSDPVWKLQDPGCDQGYGSERSPEEDFAERKKQALENYLRQLRQLYPFMTEENTFSVVVEKDGRGLGMSVSGGGESGLVRIRRLYPPQPAWRTGQLAPKDILLAANSMPLAGLSTYEALEVLRTAGSKVELLVCRSEDPCASPPHVPPPAPPRLSSGIDPLNCHPNHNKVSHTGSNNTTSSSEGRACSMERQNCHHHDQNNYDGSHHGDYDGYESGDREKKVKPKLRIPADQEVCLNNVQYGEFDIEMTKLNGSLGFTLRKEDQSALGHYVRALVREPALSDGRIQSGDRIVAVNDVAMSSLSHAEAVSYLRSCGDRVLLRLYRDASADALSPTDELPEPRTNTNLRQEARCMLNELAARRMVPSPAPTHSPRRSRRPHSRESAKHKLQSSTPDMHTEFKPVTEAIEPVDKTELPEPVQVEFDQSIVRNESFELENALTPGKKQKMFLTVAPNGYELNNLDNDTLDAPSCYHEHQDQDKNSHLMQATFVTEMANEPMSMPLEINDENHFSHRNPAYQSAVLQSNHSNRGSGDQNRDEDTGLQKWKGVTLSPETERKALSAPREISNVVVVVANPITFNKREQEAGNENVSKEPTILTVELNRGWNSRLGFSVQCHPESGQSYISAIYGDSVAARDGRLKQGDIILQVNDENVTSMKTQDVIDLLRILRGSICITILRPSVQ